MATLRDEINALNRAAPQPDPFSSFEFFENFLRCEKVHLQDRSLRLWFLTAFSATRLVGYLALKEVTHRVFGRHVSRLDFLVTHDADRPRLVTTPEFATQVCTAFYLHLLQRKREWSYLEFRQQEPDSPLFPPPPAIDLKEYLVRRWRSMDNGTIPVRWDSLDAYFKSLSKKFRSNVSRQMRSLLAAGSVEYLISADPATTPALFALYLDIEQHSWKSHDGVTIGRHSEWAAYFLGLLDARQPMKVSIQVLLLDGLPVAGLITGTFERGLYALHIVSDESMNLLAPGSAVLLMGMRQAIEGRYHFFNLLSGFGYYKERWQANMSETQNIQIYQVGGLAYWHRKLGDWARWLRSARPARAALLFNPMRRGAGERDGQQHPCGATPLCRRDSEQRTRTAALVAEVRKGAGEFLSAKEFAMVMPFETQRRTVVKK
jgi:hypothetical protein